jgi:hypothetical protein
MFSQKDLEQFKEKKIDISRVEEQIENFKKGFEYVKLTAAATPGKGLISPSEEEALKLAEYFENEAKSLQVLKFVPASGAASRMFKHLFEFKEKLENGQPIEKLFEDKSFNSPYNFFHNIKNFAFFDALEKTVAGAGDDLNRMLDEGRYAEILDYFLTSKGLNYGNLPKGLLLFHKYPDGSRLAIEEHLLEGIHYACGNDKIVRIHFTVSENHKALFKEAFDRLVPRYEEKYGVKFDISMSVQKSSTDTVAVDMDNNPFRLDDGSILFRPGGHGALIENLNDLDADVIFIKNIDNIVPDRLRDHTYLYKKTIGGKLLEIREKINNYLENLDAAQLTDEELYEMKSYLENDLQQKISEDFGSFNRMEKIDFLYTRFNRPLRVCGMVKNEGEPGGGPFFVMKNGKESLQIVESSQIDFSDPAQASIVKNATHFNPVDLVCSTKDYQGNKFDLTQFVDPETGFISKKSKDGRDLKAQELPGLWNGAMAEWITLFVEVPIITFNPVKTINDLLRENHR